MECGVDAIWPLERAANMDPVRIRREFGRDLRLCGGVDKPDISLENFRYYIKRKQDLLKGAS